ncbi:UNVERIFIED_CONTAM: ribonuclease III [Campylobacter lari]
MKNKTLDQFLKEDLNLKVNNLSYYRLALTHSSYKFITGKKSKNYETLEFLGDAILQFLSSDFIFKKYLNNYEQGKMTLFRSKLVCTETLNHFTDELGLKDYVLTGQGNMKNEIFSSKKVGADLFEALIAAIYLDEGLGRVKQFLEKTLFPYSEKLEQKTSLKDSKTIFQEYVQSFSKNSVIYKTVMIENKMFHAEVIHDNKIFGIGTGKSKNEAEEEAASEALKKLQIKN